MIWISILAWMLLAAFNIYKIYQSLQGADMIESVFAIVLAPIYTVIALVVIFVIKPWN